MVDICNRISGIESLYDGISVMDNLSQIIPSLKLKFIIFCHKYLNQGGGRKCICGGFLVIELPSQIIVMPKNQLTPKTNAIINYL